LASDLGPASSSTPRSGNSPTAGFLNRIFLTEEGLRSGWSVFLYLAFWYAALWTMTVFVANILLPMFPRLAVGTFSPASVLIQEIIGFAAAYGAALLMARLEQRDAGVYGLPLQKAFGTSFWQGVALGLAEVSLLIGLISAFGGYSFGKLVLHGVGILGWGVLWSCAFVLVGLAEEFLFRGYVQYRLSRSVGFWPAAVFLSLIFAAGHWGNPGEGLVGLASVAVTGLVFALALRRTGNLWVAVGWHAAFDFGETFLFSVPDSGVLYDKHLSNAVLHGEPWLTGGSAGPEGSLFSFVTLGLSALLIHFLFPAKKESSARIDSSRQA
jgi:membrane protease YdiL (CAAX protease family)